MMKRWTEIKMLIFVAWVPLGELATCTQFDDKRLPKVRSNQLKADLILLQEWLVSVSQRDMNIFKS